jgi:hypothetical protein
MNPRRSIFLLFLMLYGAGISPSQTGEVGPIRSSAAYAEVLLRRTQLQADLEALSPDYTEANPKILDLRNELAALTKSGERMYNVKPTETGKLTLALGKLIVEQARLQADLGRLLRSYSNDNTEVKRARRKVEVFESAINEILK